MVIASTRVKLNNINFLYRIGNLSEKDMHIVKVAMREFDFRSFNTIYNFCAWLLNNYVSDTVAIDGSNNNNVNSTQTLQEIAKSKKANCIDIANAIHNICYKNKNQKHWIIIARFYVTHIDSWEGHIYTIVENYNGRKSVLDYYRDSENPLAEIREYYDKDVNDVIQIENQRLKPAFDKIFGTDTRCTSTVIDDRDFHVWDSYVKKKKSQTELLRVFS